LFRPFVVITSPREDHMTEEDQKDRDFVCSFCGKEAPEIQGMIASQTHSGIICDECLN
jgi:DNA-directed RNA polymerase subunit RPC12/RpoP